MLRRVGSLGPWLLVAVAGIFVAPWLVAEVPPSAGDYPQECDFWQSGFTYCCECEQIDEIGWERDCVESVWGYTGCEKEWAGAGCG